MRRSRHLLMNCVLFQALVLHAQQPSQPQNPPPNSPPRLRLDVHPAVGTIGSVPASTLLHIRLCETVSSFGSRQNSPVTAIVIQPALLNDQIVLPLGTELRGKVERVRRIGLGFSSETALIDLVFTGIRVPGGEWRNAIIKITEVDNSRETVDATGTIHGIRATAAPARCSPAPLSPSPASIP